jgi:hypothetical protein
MYLLSISDIFASKHNARYIFSGFDDPRLSKKMLILSIQNERNLFSFYHLHAFNGASGTAEVY